MAQMKLKVTYVDGRETEIVVSPKAQVETERHFKSTDQASAQRIESHYFMAWAALHYAGQEPADFDAFLGTIADVEESEQTVEDEAGSDPTPAAQSTTGLSA